VKRVLTAIALTVSLLFGSIFTIAPPASAGYIGTGCWNLWVDDHLSWAWITTAKVHLEVDNVCVFWNAYWPTYGDWIITSTPTAWSSHYNNPIFELWCGYQNWNAGWFGRGVYFDWGASVAANFIATPLSWNFQCFQPLQTVDGIGIWVYAGGYGPFAPPLVANTSENWSGP
jgi:hypothetical protein